MRNVTKFALLTWLGLLSCAGTQAVLHPEAVRIRQIQAGMQRSWKEVDIDANARIEQRDVELWNQSYSLLSAEAQRRGLELSPQKSFYHGPKDGKPATLASFDPTTVASLSDDDLRLLTIETRWFLAQARIGTIAQNESMEHHVAGTLASALAGYNNERMEPGQLCRAVTELNVQPFVEHNMKPIAVFDMDSTVWDGNVSDGLLAVLIEHRLIKSDAGTALAEFLKSQKGISATTVNKNDVYANAQLMFDRATDPKVPKEERISLKDTFYQIVGLLRGMTRAEASAAAKLTFEKGSQRYGRWQDRFFASTDGCGSRQLIKTMQQRGVEIFLLSATPDVLAHQAAEILGVPQDHVLGSTLEDENGQLTGKVADSTYYSKGSIVRQWLPLPPLLVFGDSPTSDFPMMKESVGGAFMINPRNEFVELDSRDAEGWLVAVPFAQTEAGAKVVQ